MWREQPPGFPQLLAVGFLGFLVVIGAAISLTGRDPNRQQMQIIELSREWTDDFSYDTESWISPIFDWEGNSLRGRVPVGQGYAVAVREVRPSNVTIRATTRVEDAPSDTVTSTGVLCRADATGNGYYFLISSNGRVSIQKALPSEPDLIPLIDWTTHPAVNDLADRNVLNASCVADYLVLYVNGEYTVQARDSDIARGSVGVTLAGNANGADGFVRAVFDDVTVWESAARR